MERLLMDALLKWKSKVKRKPLVIHGARQVGKTWLMKEFGRRHYEDYVYINFDNNTRMTNAFERDFDNNRILSVLKINSGKSIEADNIFTGRVSDGRIK